MEDLYKTEDLYDPLRPLIDQYGFALYAGDERHLSIRSPRCIIEIVFERYDYGSWVYIKNPLNERGSYDLLLVMAMRHPAYRASGRRHDESLGDEQNRRLDLAQITDTLVRYCPDLLAGDFASICREGYAEFASYVHARMPMVLNMPGSDPIKVKFWQGDFTWVRDLQGREKRSGLGADVP